MNRLLALSVLLGSSLGLFAADGGVRQFTFSRDNVGKLPKGWSAEQTGQGTGSVWRVIADADAPSKTGYALAQLAASPHNMFNLCVVNDAAYTDVTLDVSFKAVRGKEDQGGGLVWRYRDADNYYICRMNPLEDNFRVYKVVGGKRTQLDTKEGLKVPAGEWHSIRVTMADDHIECSLDGKKLLEARDNTFAGSGKIGLWTKADAQSYFDSLTVKGK